MPHFLGCSKQNNPACFTRYASFALWVQITDNSHLQSSFLSTIFVSQITQIDAIKVSWKQLCDDYCSAEDGTFVLQLLLLRRYCISRGNYKDTISFSFLFITYNETSKCITKSLFKFSALMRHCLLDFPELGIHHADDVLGMVKISLRAKPPLSGSAKNNKVWSSQMSSKLKVSDSWCQSSSQISWKLSCLLADCQEGTNEGVILKAWHQIKSSTPPKLLMKVEASNRRLWRQRRLQTSSATWWICYLVHLWSARNGSVVLQNTFSAPTLRADINTSVWSSALTEHQQTNVGWSLCG